MRSASGTGSTRTAFCRRCSTSPARRPSIRCRSLTAIPIPDGFSRLGYDAVVRDVGKTEGELNFPPSFGCSPLSCNGMAEEYPVNRYCLVDDLDTAVPMARHFATGNCEPGAYCVVEVWRREP